jgi:cobaltochelatase CobN
MKISGIIWGGELPLLSRACIIQGIEHSFITSPAARNHQNLDRFLSNLTNSDLVLIHPSTDPFWDELIPHIPKNIPLIPIGYDQEGFSLSNVPLKTAIIASTYYIYGGEKNFDNLIRYLRAEVLGENIPYDPPEPTAWDGIYHPMPLLSSPL